jgi:membrane-bound lytic murein transglycosylase B
MDFIKKRRISATISKEVIAQALSDLPDEKSVKDSKKKQKEKKEKKEKKVPLLTLPVDLINQRTKKGKRN